MTGANDGGGSRIVFRDSRNQRPLASGTSNQIPEYEGGVTRECDSYELMGPTLMFLTAIREQEGERGDPSNEPSEKLDHNFPDLSAATRVGPGPVARIQGESEARGTVTERPPQSPAEHASESNYIDEGTYDTVYLERSRSKYLFLSVF